MLYSFHLRGDQQGAVFIMAEVKGDDANGVSSDYPGLVAGIEQHKSKHAFEIVDEFCTFLAVKRQDYLAITPGLVRIIRRGLPNVFMVVDLTIHGECCLMLGIDQRLRTTRYIDNCESFVHKYGRIILIHARPIWTPVALKFGDLKRIGAHLFRSTLIVEYGSDGTHVCRYRCRKYANRIRKFHLLSKNPA